MDRIAINKNDFVLRGEGDDLRVDQLCRTLLRSFYDQLIDSGVDPAEATGYAGGADYFVRDFLVDRMRLSPFSERAGTIRQFAGNWYIINTLEPNLSELMGMLAGIRELYRFLNRENLISAEFVAQVEQECDDTDFYRSRIESFWNITGDGYGQWDRECSLKCGPIGEEM